MKLCSCLKNRPWFWLVVLFFLAAGYAGCQTDGKADGKGEPAPGNGKKEEALTFNDLYKKGITAFIDREFSLKTELKWDYADVKIPEDPTPQQEVEKKAFRLQAPFEIPDLPAVKAKKYLQASSPRIAKKKDAAGKEYFAFEETALVNGGKVYTLKVRLKLRPPFTADKLENPTFRSQSDNPRYWNQTFELEILEVNQ